MKKISARDIRNLEALNTTPTKKVSHPVLSIDYGEKFCGISWSPDGVVVFPLDVFSRDSALVKIKNVIDQKNISTIVMGLPLGSRNEENHICAQIRSFSILLEACKKKIFFQNERFSSQAVMGSAGRIDDLAAAKILEYWLESH